MVEELNVLIHGDSNQNLILSSPWYLPWLLPDFGHMEPAASSDIVKLWAGSKIICYEPAACSDTVESQASCEVIDYDGYDMSTNVENIWASVEI